MLIFIDGYGTVEKIVPEHIYQGSNVSQITVIANSFPQTTTAQIAFILPDGTSSNYFPMQGVFTQDNTLYYQFTVLSQFTQLAGQCSIAIKLYDTASKTQTTQLAEFVIEPSVLPTLPDTPSQDEWDIFLQYLQENSVSIQETNARIDGLFVDLGRHNPNDFFDLTDEQIALLTATIPPVVKVNNFYFFLYEKSGNDLIFISPTLISVGKAEIEVLRVFTDTKTAQYTKSSLVETSITVNGIKVTNIDFDSDPQEQIDTLRNDLTAEEQARIQGDQDTLAQANQYTDNKLSMFQVYEIVTELPPVGRTDRLYLIADGSGQGNLYTEWLYTAENGWEKVGVATIVNGTIVKVNNQAVAELNFTSNPQTQIDNIVNGITVVGKANADGNGDVIADTYVKRALLQSYYWERTATLTANLVDTKPIVNTINYLEISTTNTTFDFGTANKVSISRVLATDIELSQQQGITSSIAFAFSRNATVEFAGRVLIDGVVIANPRAFAYQQYNGEAGFTTTNELTFTIRFDNIVGTQSFTAGQTLTIELFTRQNNAQSLTTRYWCGVSVQGVDRYCLSSLSLQGIAINTNQITDGAVTLPKLSQDVQDVINGAVRFDEAQTLTEAEQLQARNNINAQVNRKLIYEETSSDPAINLGFPLGIYGGQTAQVDLSAYSLLYIGMRYSEYTTTILVDLTRAGIIKTGDLPSARQQDLVNGERYASTMEIASDRQSITLVDIGFLTKDNTYTSRNNNPALYEIYRIEGV